jgi:hypothetical protein
MPGLAPLPTLALADFGLEGQPIAEIYLDSPEGHDTLSVVLLAKTDADVKLIVAPPTLHVAAIGHTLQVVVLAPSVREAYLERLRAANAPYTTLPELNPALKQ